MTFLARRHAMMTHAGISHRVRSTDSKPTCGHEHNSRPQLMRARKPSCSGRSSSTLASAVCQSTFARLRSWRAVPTLLSAASRRTWRADHRGGGRNVDAGGRGRAMSVLACSKAAIRAVGLDGRRSCVEASTLGRKHGGGGVRFSGAREGTRVL